MTERMDEQIRRFWLHGHHLDQWYDRADMLEVAGACGLQNTPPGAWETAMFNRIAGCGLADMEQLLYRDKSLVQAWSYRGAPVVFPTAESEAFLSALRPEGDEPWIYTQGIGLALDFLQMPFAELQELLRQVMPLLDTTVIESKTALDQTLAQWIGPLLPEEKRSLWNAPSMYGSPDKQTVGQAVVSFLLRTCALDGLVVFGQRQGISPTFTSYKNWTGHELIQSTQAIGQLVRKFLHCYGPATADTLERWLGCSKQQAQRMWAVVADEMEPVIIDGKKAFILSEDKAQFQAAEPLQRELLLLGGHDPYLDQRNRTILLSDRSLHRQVWRTTTNPGAILRSGGIIGIWQSKKKGRLLEIKMTLWDAAASEKQKLQELAEAYAAFRQLKLHSVELRG